ncbi:hypothetical protein EMIT051CA3_20431 [Pseudomonas chlororaphis]
MVIEWFVMDICGLLSTALQSGTNTDIICQSVRRELPIGKITLGQAIKTLRTKVSKMNQDDFAALYNLSRRTLSEVELDRGNPTLKTLSRIFAVYNF